MSRIIALAIGLLLGLSGQAFAAEPVVTGAVDGILDAFHSHPLVGLGEYHGMAQEADFYLTLLRDPRFASEVGNVVMEVGEAGEQAIADRFVNGEHVPYAALRKVWADTAGGDPTMPFIGTMNVYDTIREVNMKLPPDKRIKVWLGDPPIDWAKIRSKAEIDQVIARRETFAADLIGREILAKGKKALVIYGGQHFTDMGGLQNTHFDAENLRALVERAHPGAFYYVAPYVGTNTKACAAEVESHTANWHAPALIAPIRGTPLEAGLLPPGCGAYPILPGMSEAEYTIVMRNYAGLTSDALLYLGPRGALVWDSMNPDIYLDLDFRAELARRRLVRTGKPLDDFTSHDNPAVPPHYFPD